jgi:hypothetical protein
MSAAGVTVSLPAKGASVELALSAFMPCFQAGGGAAGAAVWAKACPMPNVKTAVHTAIFLNIKKLLNGCEMNWSERIGVNSPLVQGYC